MLANVGCRQRGRAACRLDDIEPQTNVLCPRLLCPHPMLVIC